MRSASRAGTPSGAMGPSTTSGPRRSSKKNAAETLIEELLVIQSTPIQNKSKAELDELAKDVTGRMETTGAAYQKYRKDVVGSFVGIKATK